MTYDTIDKTSDLAVETDVVEVGVSGLDVSPVLLALVAFVEDVLLSIVGVVVHVDLAVHADHIAVGGLRERIDLEQDAVALAEHLVELLHDLNGLAERVTAEAELVSDAQRLLFGEAARQVDGLLDDGVRMLGGDLLDVAAALCARYHHRALVLAREREREVELATRKQSLAHHHLFISCTTLFFYQFRLNLIQTRQSIFNLVARLSLSARLLCVETVSKHVLGYLFGLFRRVDQLDAASHAAVKRAFASTARQYLSLYDHVFSKLF